MGGATMSARRSAVGLFGFGKKKDAAKQANPPPPSSTPAGPGMYESVERFTMMYEDGVIVGVEIITSPDACHLCKALAGRTFVPPDVPQLPLPGCTRPGGCNSAYRPMASVAEHP